MYYYLALALLVDNKNNKNSGICCCKIVTFAHIFVGQRKWWYSKEDAFGYTCMYLCMCMYLYVCVCGGGRGAGERRKNSPTIQSRMKSI
jgi:hypothetical protein